MVKKLKNLSSKLIMCLLFLWLIESPRMIRAALKSKSENHLRSRVVRLVSERGSCSGEQIKAPSGEDYILTAAHCAVLAKDGSIETITEDGKHLLRKVIAKDGYSDLMLLEGVPNMEGIPVADDYDLHEHVRTFTHGRGFATYKTEGELIQIVRVRIPIFIEDIEKCDTHKYEVIASFNDFALSLTCMLSVDEIATNAMTVPGSSGGLVVNDDNELVGVVSEGDGVFGYLVRLSDIQKFLEAY